MASLNKVMIIGNLTRDPELRYTPKGQAVVDLALAMNRRYVVDGEKREEVTYVDVTFWGKGAEIISQYMKKGNPMYIEGRLRLGHRVKESIAKAVKPRPKVDLVQRKAIKSLAVRSREPQRLAVLV